MIPVRKTKTAGRNPESKHKWILTAQKNSSDILRVSNMCRIKRCDNNAAKDEKGKCYWFLYSQKSSFLL